MCHYKTTRMLGENSFIRGKSLGYFIYSRVSFHLFPTMRYLSDVRLRGVDVIKNAIDP